MTVGMFVATDICGLCVKEVDARGVTIAGEGVICDDCWRTLADEIVSGEGR